MSLHHLWLEVTGAVFLVDGARIGRHASVREYGKYHAGQLERRARGGCSLFTLTFAWFGVSSFWRVAARANGNESGVSDAQPIRESCSGPMEKLKSPPESRQTSKPPLTFRSNRSTPLPISRAPTTKAKLAIPGNIPSRAAFRPPCTAVASGPCVSTPAWATPRNRTSATNICWPTAPRVSRWRSICRRRSAWIPITRWRWAKSARSESRSIPSKTCSGCSMASNSRRFRHR